MITRLRLNERGIACTRLVLEISRWPLAFIVSISNSKVNFIHETTRFFPVERNARSIGIVSDDSNLQWETRDKNRNTRVATLYFGFDRVRPIEC